MSNIQRKHTKCFIYGFTSFRLTVEQFLCSSDDVDWLVSLEEWNSETETFVPSNNKAVQDDLVARALFRAWDTEK